MKRSVHDAAPRATRSITRTLLTSVLAVYFLLTLLITTGQVALEYQNTRDNLLNDLRNQHHTFAASIARALWEFNQTQAETIASGLTSVPAISGVIVRDEQGRVISKRGLTMSAQQIEGLIDSGEIPEQQGIFGYYSPLIYEFAGRSEVVGDVMLFSNRDITIERLKPSIFLLFVGALIKSSLLILLFSLAFKFYLRLPLEELIRQIRNFDLNNPERSVIQLKQLETNEFSLLEDAYNDLIERLRQHQIALKQTEEDLTAANQQLEEQNLVLEQEIAEKTLGISNLMLDLERRRHDLEVRQHSLEQEIHQRRITESKLKQTNKDLQESVEFLQQTKSQLVNTEKMATLGNLVASITHEVNTPLGISLTSATFLREQVNKLKADVASNKLSASALDSFIHDIEEGLSLINGNLERANELLTGFKQVAVDQSSEANRSVLLPDYLRRVVKTLQPSLRSKNITTDIDCPDITASFFTGALAQVLTNMIMNSVIHGFTDKNQGCINITVRVENNILHFTYTDNGQGMSSNELNHLFEAFFTTQAENGGSGLGTHIIHKLVTETLNGEITVSSKLGEGLTYQFSFPVTLTNAN